MVVDVSAVAVRGGSPVAVQATHDDPVNPVVVRGVDDVAGEQNAVPLESSFGGKITFHNQDAATTNGVPFDADRVESRGRRTEENHDGASLGPANHFRCSTNLSPSAPR